MAEGKVTSLADIVYERVEEDILTGAYQRGDVLTELKLSEKLNVSRTPGAGGPAPPGAGRSGGEPGQDHCGGGGHPPGPAGYAGDPAAAGGACHGHVLPADRAEGAGGAGRDRHPPGVLCLPGPAGQDPGVRQPLPHGDLCRLRQPVFDKQLTGLLKRLMRHRKLSVSDNQRAQKSTAEHRAIFNALAAGDAAQAEVLATQHVERARDNILINEQAAAI